MLTRKRFGLAHNQQNQNFHQLSKSSIGKGILNGTTTKSQANFTKNHTFNIKKETAHKIAENNESNFREFMLKPLIFLSKEQIDSFELFSNQRRAIRTKLLIKDPKLFTQLDKDCGYDPASVSDFTETIFNYLQNQEFIKQPLISNFLSNCNDVTPRMRYILVNWLVQVHQSYKLQPETLYLCISIIDRYIQKSGTEITKDLFQLVGITALFVAAKFEETYPPDIDDFSSITDNAYTKHDLRNCEQLILQSLDFYLSMPAPIVFLRRLSRVLESDRCVHNLSKYLLELTIQEYNLTYLPGNLKAVTAMCLSLAVYSRIDDLENVWNDKLEYLSGYPLESIRIPLRILAKAAYRQNSPSKYRAIYDKYRLEDMFDKVASLPQLRSAVMESLADLKFNDDGTEIIATN